MGAGPVPWQEATTYLERVIKLDPHNGRAWHTLGMLEEVQGHLEQALECFSMGQQCTGEHLKRFMRGARFAMLSSLLRYPACPRALLQDSTAQHASHGRHALTLQTQIQQQYQKAFWRLWCWCACRT
jgi:cytochrome c-type biogenesis protein CcmH/NrfG